MAGDSKSALRIAVSVHIGANCGVLDAFDQTQSKQLQRNSKRDIALPNSLIEIRLFKIAARSVGPPLKCEQAVDSPVAGSVHIEFETNFSKRAIRIFEGGHCVST